MTTKTIAQIVRNNPNLNFVINGEDCSFADVITVEGRDVACFHIIGGVDLVFVYGSDTGVAVNNGRKFDGFLDLKQPEYTHPVVLEVWERVAVKFPV